MGQNPVISGIGIVSPQGGVAQMWDAIVEGSANSVLLDAWNGTALPRPVRIQPFADDAWRRLDAVRAGDRPAGLSFAGAEAAIADAGLEKSDFAKLDLVYASTSVGWPGGEDLFLRFRSSEPNDAAAVRASSPTIGCDLLARRYGPRAAHGFFSAACASGVLALGYASDLVDSGQADIVLVGGGDALATVPILGFANMRIVSQRGCRPFDHRRDGMVLSEGAAFFVVERYDTARARGANIHAEILGHGAASDADHMTKPSLGGIESAMRAACADSGLGVDDICAIHAHGTGTRVNDLQEAAAIRRFMARDMSVPITATKSITGHMQGCAGFFSAAISCLMLSHGVVPPIYGFEAFEGPEDLDFVAGGSRPLEDGAILTNAFGFGGITATLALGRAQ